MNAKNLILTAFTCMIATVVGAGGAEKTQQAVWVSGTQGYHTYRIPALVVTPKGTVLAFCEGRKHGSGDAGDIDLLVRRSTDNGRTWSEQAVIWDDKDHSCGNPCPVVDMHTGTVWLLSTWNRGDDLEPQIINGQSKDIRRVFVISSGDDGKTWSEPKEITGKVSKPDWTWYATGPGSGIQLKHGSMQDASCSRATTLKPKRNTITRTSFTATITARHGTLVAGHRTIRSMSAKWSSWPTAG